MPKAKWARAEGLKPEGMRPFVVQCPWCGYQDKVTEFTRTPDRDKWFLRCNGCGKKWIVWDLKAEGKLIAP